VSRVGAEIRCRIYGYLPGSLCSSPTNSRHPNADLLIAVRRVQDIPAATTPPTNQVASTTVDQTVAFHDDLSSSHNVFPVKSSLPDSILKSVQEERTHDVTDFLGRPVRVRSGVITPSQGFADTVTTVSLPTDILLQDMYREKLRGFLSIRATVNLRFQANPQRFQQGRLLITYFPQDTLNPKKAGIVASSMTLLTQLPRVEFDFATDTDVALSIPYVSPTLGFNQVTGTGQMGSYDVRVYSPLVSPGGPAEVDWSLWVWLTDVELDFPAFTPQSGKPKRQTRKLEPSEMETKPISGILSRVSKAATLFKDVPLLSSIAGTVSWATAIMANTASSFGFSNPDTANTSSLSHMNVAHDIANVNAIGNSVSLGLLSDNKVATLPGFSGTDIDEMSFNYLTSIPSYLSRTTWGSATPSGIPIYQTQLHPGAMMTRSDSNLDYVYPTPMLYIANMFRYWRTGFTFTFKFVKTEFHSGRLAVVFSPGTTTTFDQSRFLYREIIDIRESNEFTITIPYTSTLPYLSRTNAGIYNFDNMGFLTIYVLNPLVAPATVSPSITMITEVCADNTFEVAVPQNMIFSPVCYQPGTGAPALVAETEEEFEPQALGENAQDSLKGATTMAPAPSIAGIQNNDGGLAASMYCIGEKITSLRSLAKRAAPIIDSGAAANVATYFRPKIVSLDNCSDNVTQAAAYALDYISMIAPLYNYQRGGLKFHAYCPGASSSNSYIRAGLAPNMIGTVPIVRATSNAIAEVQTNNALAIHTGPLVAGGLSFTVPQYSQTHCEMYRIYTQDTYTLPTDIYCSDLRVFIKGNTGSNNTRILRQAADDWTCGFFTGCMPIRDLSIAAQTPLATM
jgi:hypothetical protein